MDGCLGRVAEGVGVDVGGGLSGGGRGGCDGSAMVATNAVAAAATASAVEMWLHHDERMVSVMTLGLPPLTT